MKDLLMMMLKNKEQMIKSILKDIDTCSANMASFEKLEDLLKSGKEVSAESVHKASAKSLRHVNEVNRKLLLVALVTISSGDFDGDIAQVLSKLGYGKEAMQEIFRQKMGAK